MQSRWGRPTRSHTAPSPSLYILKATACGAASADLNPRQGCPGDGEQHPAFLSLASNICLTTTAHAVPTLTEGKGGCCALLWVLPDPGRSRNSAIYRMHLKYCFIASLNVGRSGENGDFNLRYLKYQILASIRWMQTFVIQKTTKQPP